jgi:predicted site-specific integrase-resolvase
MDETEASSRWMTRVEAAAHLGVSLRAIKRWMDLGKLHFEREARNGRVRVRVDSVESDLRTDVLG